MRKHPWVRIPPLPPFRSMTRAEAGRSGLPHTGRGALEDVSPVPDHRTGRDRRLLPALPVASPGSLGLAVAAGRAEPAAVRLAAALPRYRRRACLRRIWRGLRGHRADVAVGGGWRAAHVVG